MPLFLLERILSMTSALFPYGTFSVDPICSERFKQDYSNSDAYTFSLPQNLPYHHPLLRRLEGVYPLESTLPPWWPACIAQVEPALLKPVLASASLHEFRTGCLKPSRWQALRTSLSSTERSQLPHSPKIAALVESTDWSGRFQNRGPVDTPEQLTLVVSTQPLDFLYMSNGREWQSCQHFRDGEENHRLPGNFYDTGVAVAFILSPQTHIEDEASVLARTTLRVFCLQGQTVLTIGRVYHNDETLAFLLLTQLAKLLDAQQLAWGWIANVNSSRFCQEGALGPTFRQRFDQESVWAESELCWFPSNWYTPYVDGGDSTWDVQWNRDLNHYSRQLCANIIRMRPRFPAYISAQIHHTFALRPFVGMRPPFR
jgi:hypothetical protein